MSPLPRMAALLLGIALVFSQKSALGVAPGPEEAALLEGLVLHVRESGPLRPWIIAIENATDEGVNLVKDPRLLAFKVTVPGKKKPINCRLPEAMLPSKAEPERLRRLEPGQELRFRIDPRFYCFDGDNGVLVPGAMLEATYGFEGATRTTTRGGRKVTERLPSVPPYVAQFLPEAPVEEPASEEGTESEETADTDADEAEPSKNERSNGSKATGEQSNEEASKPNDDAKEEPIEFDPVPHDPDQPGLRSLNTVKLALGSEYASWDPNTRDEALTRGLVLEVLKGSDSLTARGAEVTVRITNRGHRQQRLYVRRELISYYLLGPEGLSVCEAAPEERAPDGQSFTTLGPGKQIQFVTRLVEFCPGEILDRPGFYLVGAQLEASGDSNEPGVEAFAGTLYTTRGKIVRVQKGELPFVHHNVPRQGLVFAHAGKLLREHEQPADSPAAGDSGDSASGSDGGGSADEGDVFDGGGDSE